MRILGLDFETTGLDFENDRIIEVGLVLWDTDTQRPLSMFSELVKHWDVPPISYEVTEINGIDQLMVNEFGVSPAVMIQAVQTYASKAEAFAGHNVLGFDKKMLEAELKRQSADIPGLPWIDTMLDLPFPKRMKARSLNHLAADHGFLNPFAHRAVFDVLTTLRLMQGYDLAAVMKSASEPVVRLQAMVSFEDRDKAKAMGFHWKADRKAWELEMKQGKVDEFYPKCDFPVQLLNWVGMV